MTTWEWKCRSCGYSFINPIFRFIAQCPECEVEYIKLAEAQGMNYIGLKLIYVLKKEEMDFKETESAILFSLATKVKKFECYQKDFYLYLKENFKEKIAKGNVILELKEG